MTVVQMNVSYEHCSICGGPVRPVNGFVVCTGCGDVKDREFVHNDIGTYIVRPDVVLPGGTIRSPKWLIRGKQCRHLQALRDLDHVAQELNLAETARKYASTLALLLFKEFPRKTRPLLVFTALLSAIREYHCPISYLTLKSHFPTITTHRINELRFEISIIIPSFSAPGQLTHAVSVLMERPKLVERLTRYHVDIPAFTSKLIQDAIPFLTRFSEHGFSPHAKLGVALYIAGRPYVTQEECAVVAETSEVTIRDLLRRIRNDSKEVRTR